MRLFKELVVLTPGVTTPAQYVQQKIKNSEMAVELFDPQEITFPAATLVRSGTNHGLGVIDVGLEELNFWFTTLSTSLECYIWAISEEFCSFSSDSSVPSLLIYFLDNFALLPSVISLL